MTSKRRSTLVPLLAASCLLAFTGAARAGTIDVTTTEDPEGAGSCPGSPCSLRQAVSAANEGDTIQLAGSGAAPLVYSLTQGSAIVVNKSLTILGDGVDASTVDGSTNLDANKAPVRILKVTAGTVQIEGVKLTGGVDGNDENFASCSPCGTLEANGGGALFNDGATVILDNDAFDANGQSSGEPTGGAIGNRGTLEITDVSFTNDGAAFGGALFSRGGTVTVNRATFEEDGLSAFDGGAIFLFSGGTTTLTNSTIVNSGWASSFGGGIDNSGSTLTLINDTLSGNIRGALETDVGASTSVQNTILASGFSDGADFNCVAAGKGNNAGTETAQAITHDLGNNIDQDGACALDASGDQSTVDPKLAPIADNGGPTRTQALLAGSPALEAGNNEACPATDQRAIVRPQGARCDIGAFEAELIGEHPVGGGETPIATPIAVVSSGPPVHQRATLATLPSPVLGKVVNVETVSGTVLIALPPVGKTSGVSPAGRASASLRKGLTFIPLQEARQIPVGSILDTTAGVARIETATASKPQFGNFGAGLFKLLQQRKQRGLTEMDIIDTHSARQACATLGKKAGIAKHLSAKILGKLSGNAHGRFTTRGQYSAATVRGTIWSVTNRCDGTLTHVTRDVVTVRDFHRRKTITLLSGQSYLARAPHS